MCPEYDVTHSDHMGDTFDNYEFATDTIGPTWPGCIGGGTLGGGPGARLSRVLFSGDNCEFGGDTLER